MTSNLKSNECPNCGLKSWWNTTIIHYDIVADDKNPLRHYCTFCREDLG